MTKLLIISSAPVVSDGQKIFLDIKFYEGILFYCRNWDGSVTVISETQTEKYPFGDFYDRAALPFEVRTMRKYQSVQAADILGFDIVMCSGDSHKFFHVSKLCRAAGVPLVYMIENILETRLQIVWLDHDRGLLHRLYSMMWLLWQERKRREAFRMASGLEANGYPAFEAYSALNENSILYLDNRTEKDMFATAAERAARRVHILCGGKLRLIHSGRLEPLKGSQDLVPIAKELARHNIDFELNIFGTGSLEEQIRRDATMAGVQDRVLLHGAVDFRTELVPFTRQNADIFLSCHRQSDPSCTYLEAMGCGVPILGYANRMWSALCRESNAGWVRPLGKPLLLAQEILRLDKARSEIADASDHAFQMAELHGFGLEFGRRVDHLRELVTS